MAPPSSGRAAAPHPRQPVNPRSPTTTARSDATSAALLHDFVLNLQLPSDAEAALKARESLRRSAAAEGEAPSAEASRCPHLLAYLPDRLDLSFARCRRPPGSGSPPPPPPPPTAAAATKKKKGTLPPPHPLQPPSKAHRKSGSGAADRTQSPPIASHHQHFCWALANPVHALHLASQIEDPPLLLRGRTGERGGLDGPTEPLLYGEEQERLLALQTEGVPEAWHPWVQEAPTAVVGESFRPPAQSGAASADAAAAARRAPTSAAGEASASGTTGAADPAGSGPPVAAEPEPVPSSAPPPESQEVHPPPVKSDSPSAMAGASPPPSGAAAKEPLGLPLIAESSGEPPTPAAVASSSEAAAGETPPAGSDPDAVGSLSQPTEPVPVLSSDDARTLSPRDEQSTPRPHPLDPPREGGASAATVPQSSSAEAQPEVPGSRSDPDVAPPAGAGPDGDTVGNPPNSTAAKEEKDEESRLTAARSDAVPPGAAASPPPSATAAVPPETKKEQPPKSDVDAGADAAAPRLPEGQYWSWHAKEEQLRLLRRAFLSRRGGTATKRKAPNATTPTSSASAPPTGSQAAGAQPKNKKRKLDEVSSAKAKGAAPASSFSASMSAPSPATASSSLSAPSAALKHLLALRRGRILGGDAGAVATSAQIVDVHQWVAAREEARKQVHRWVFHYRLAREAYWRERQQRLRRQCRRQHQHQRAFCRQPLMERTFGAIRNEVENDGGATYHTDDNDSDLEWDPIESLACVPCSSGRAFDSTDWDLGNWDTGARDTRHRLLRGDQVLHCLDCFFVGCAPVAKRDFACTGDSREHILQHMLSSKHNFAVTCGPQAKIYCFKCGDFVQHEVFEQEKERIDVGEKFPWMGWKDHPVQRSFDALRFMRVLDQGIVWSGMFATYPPLVPPAHVKAARLCVRRQLLFQGDLAELPEDATPDARAFAMYQGQKEEKDRFRPVAPVGMYNLGNTCFMSAILQCLVHCVPLQHYFLREIGHNHMACGLYKTKTHTQPRSGDTLEALATSSTGNVEVCLACELDKVFLQYVGSAAGFDVISILRRKASISPVNGALTCQDASGNSLVTGDPLVTAEMLTAAWNCGGMSHLAGYDQRDAHEFLHGFLEFLGKDVRQHRERVQHFINLPRPANSIVPELNGIEKDAVKTIFEGTLRSVLLCGKCGSKRIQSEPFMSLSLPLTKEVQEPGSRHGPMSVERCLRHFITPETLTDSVDCPTCREKTPTTKQHVVSRLPKVLCLHLKRFDAAHNKKIEDFVEFPVKGLNMGPFLPHWCEVTRGVNAEIDQLNSDMPCFLYDLVGTVNHFGTLQSGHYVANVVNDSKWYHCNDAHVSFAGTEGDGSKEVASSSGAYLLFYVRR